MPAPGGARPPGHRKTYGPVPVPPPLRPVGPSPLRPDGPPAPIPPPLPPALPPDAQAAGQPGRDDDDGDEQTTVDPQALKGLLDPPADPAPVSAADAAIEAALDAAVEPPEGAAVEALEIDVVAEAGDPGEISVDVDIDAKSTTTEAISDDSGEILLEPSAEMAQLSDHLASGTGETGGASLDEPTEDEAAGLPAVLTAMREQRAPIDPRPLPRMPSSASDPALSPAWLVVQSGTDRGRRFALRGGRTSVGRGVDNDVVLTDIAVSRKHLTIDFDGATYVLSDLGSGNGTLVNDHDEDAALRLSHGDKLELGNTVLVFECTAVGMQSHPHGKWPVGQAHADDDLSTVAGHKPGKTPPGAPVNGGHAAGGHAAGHPGGHPGGHPAGGHPAGHPGQAPGHPGGHPAGHHASHPTQPPPPRERARSVPPPLPRPGGPRSAQMAAAQPPLQAPPLPRPQAPGAASNPRMPVHRAATAPPPPMRPRQMSSVPTAPAGAPTMNADAMGLHRQSTASPGGFPPYPGSGPVPQFGNMGGPGVSGARPLGPLAYPSAPAGFHVGPSTASSPRFQYPNGVMAPLPAAERRRVLIGILGLAFVAVGAGIVMALVYGGGSEEEVASNKPAATAMAKTAPADAPAAETGAPSATPLPADPAQPPAAATPPGQPAAPALLHHLYGEKELRPVDFGTDEQFLSDVSGGSDEGEKAGEGARTNDVSVADSGGDREEEARAAERRERRREARRRARDEVEAEPEEAPVEEEETTSSGAAVSASTALRRAEVLYRGKKFSEAAALLRDAAESASQRDETRLRALATSYSKIGSLLAEGQENTVSDAPMALQAFKSALRLDEEFGDSVHDRAIGARIAQVAPAAAGAYMARKDYPEAKQAADVAEKFGAGDSDRVRIVRNSLERKAEQLYEEAKSQSESGDTDAAAATARTIMRMVPRSSDVYAQAAQLTR
ncbi:MAG TPA: FHA domain-containing protein [Kofleriaceae bacterium]|nr:FHA domain-containing protein [Kofleriaceae bacterium]